MPVNLSTERMMFVGDFGYSTGDYRVCRLAIQSYSDRYMSLDVYCETAIRSWSIKMPTMHISELRCSYKNAVPISNRYMMVITVLNQDLVSNRMAFTIPINRVNNDRYCSYSIEQNAILYNIKIIPAPYYWDNRYCFYIPIQYVSERICRLHIQEKYLVSQAISMPDELVIYSRNDTNFTLNLTANDKVDKVTSENMTIGSKESDFTGSRDSLNIGINVVENGDTYQYTVDEIKISTLTTNGVPVTRGEEIKLRLLSTAPFKINITSHNTWRISHTEVKCLTPPATIISLMYLHFNGNPSERECFICSV